MFSHGPGTPEWSTSCLFTMKPSSSWAYLYHDTPSRMLCTGHGNRVRNTPANPDTGSWRMSLIELEIMIHKQTREVSRKAFGLCESQTKPEITYGEPATIRSLQKWIWRDAISLTTHCVNAALARWKLQFTHYGHAKNSTLYGHPQVSGVFVSTPPL